MNFNIYKPGIFSLPNPATTNYHRLSPLNVTQITREISIHTQVQSRCNNIIRLFAFWETDTHYYVVMERASQDLYRQVPALPLNHGRALP